jgi:HAD superfamily hydrolase (TIGR01509 family)
MTVDFAAAIFDVEGVIIDSEPAWDRAQDKFLARFGIQYDRSVIKPLLTGRSLADGTRTLRQLYDLTSPLDDLVAARLGLARSEFAAGISYLPGARSFLSSIPATVTTALATAMPIDLLEMVDATLHLRDLVDGRVSTLADVAGVGKPDPALFLHAAELAHANVGECLVFEDAPFGIEAAHAAGMVCVAVATTHAQAVLRHADLVLDSLEGTTYSSVIRQLRGVPAS